MYVERWSSQQLKDGDNIIHSHPGNLNFTCHYEYDLQDSNAGTELGDQFANRDAVHVLTYAIMMLNTDLHSTQVKKKMTLDVSYYYESSGMSASSSCIM